jgi:hypothetical protein
MEIVTRRSPVGCLTMNDANHLETVLGQSPVFCGRVVLLLGQLTCHLHAEKLAAQTRHKKVRFLRQIPQFRPALRQRVWTKGTERKLTVSQNGRNPSQFETLI